MLEIQENYDLINHNTFGIACRAKFYVGITTGDQLNELVPHPVFTNNRHLILGGGSNILFTKDFEGLVIHPAIKGIEVIYQDANEVLVRAGSGIEWDDLVAYAVRNGWGGLENLSKIPGSVGASPVQNIGAYGVEVQQVIEKVEGFNLVEGKFMEFHQNECNFSYRNSLFKQALKGQFIVNTVTFRLSRTNHKLITHYGSVEEEMKNIPERTIVTVRQAIIKIRESKLPDPKKTGNAGSFFKNPIISLKAAERIKSEFQDFPVHYVDPGFVKVSAAWLIDHAGCKGMEFGQAGIHSLQPLVLINMGNANGHDILQLSKNIQKQVAMVFSINLEPEVNII